MKVESLAPNNDGSYGVIDSQLYWKEGENTPTERKVFANTGKTECLEEFKNTCS